MQRQRTPDVLSIGSRDGVFFELEPRGGYVFKCVFRSRS